MKLSKLTYHNGAVKVEIYQKGQDRRRWNTGVRVDRKLLNKEKFIKPNDLIDWQALNIKISEEKERVDQVVRQIYKERKHIDVLAVFDILNEQEERLKESIRERNGRIQVKNGTVKKKLGSAIKDLQNSIYQNSKKPNGPHRNLWDQPISVEEATKKELKKKARFFADLRGYLDKEASATNQVTIARHLVTYLEEGTAIGYSGLKRHFRIFDFMINNPLVIADVSDSWVRKLIEWLKVGTKGKPINSNTSDWLFGRFQCFWTWALENNIVNKRIYWKRFPRRTFKPGFVWLTEAQLVQLAKIKFSNANLENARKAYLLMSVTALRHSDFHSLTSDDVISEDGQWYIHKSNKKTKTVFKVEIHEPILQWVKNDALLKKMKLSPNANKSNQELNYYIREIGKILEWAHPVRIQTDADKWETKPFYEWMSCHSGRHTAVCLWLSKRITHTAIKKATGWKGSKMIDYYADILNINTNESLNLLGTI